VRAICASFRVSSLIGISGGLIMTAHTIHVFSSLSKCTYNSYIIKNESFLACCMHEHSQFLCSSASQQTINPGCPPSQSHTFRSTALRPDIRAALYFCSHELLCLRRPLLIYVHYSDTLQSAATSKESACRIICTRTPENGGMAGHFPLRPCK